HQSEVLGETRNFRIFLPPDYGETQKRYPVIYWFHGWGERHNRPPGDRPGRNYDTGEDYGGDTIAAYVARHEVIVVKWDGYNPRTPDEKYPRPYNIGPVETHRQFPHYFPELAGYIDANYRTIPDRDHRATSGLSMGGFMSFWIAGKYPHLVSSASNFMGSSEFYGGPRGFDAEYRHDEMWPNYEGLRTRLVTGRRDFIQFYHRRMNATWLYTRPHHESEDFDFDHGTPYISRTFDFHMDAFLNPAAKPAAWSHIDVYPFFHVWGWDVASDRKRPGFTVIENASATGFRVSVREWLPDGPILPLVKVSVTTDQLFPKNQPRSVTFVRVTDGKPRRSQVKADANGRLTIELTGEDTEVGIGWTPVVVMSSYRLESAPWAAYGKLLRLRVKFLNKGGSASTAAKYRWETPNPKVVFETTDAYVPALAPGASAEVPLSFSVNDPDREAVRLYAVRDKERQSLVVPVFPEAPVSTEFRIADGRASLVFQRAIERQSLSLGRGNGDGEVSRGEQFAVLLPDRDAFRAAELFTSDRCVDLSTRISDSWAAYDHVGGSAKYSLPTVSYDCPQGHVIRMFARVQLPDKPNHTLQYATVEVTVK
ncbi:MAG: alpha/beta hydrolase-fold protein, partial [Bryobacteraceae bacterium]